MRRDEYRTRAVNRTITGRQKEAIEKAANGVWYYQKYFSQALLEDRLAGRLLSKKGVVR